MLETSFLIFSEIRDPNGPTNEHLNLDVWDSCVGDLGMFFFLSFDF